MYLLQIGCRLQKECGKRAEADQNMLERASEQEGSRKDLASTHVLRPCAHRCPISESRSDRKGNRGEPKSIFTLEIQKETSEYIY